MRRRMTRFHGKWKILDTMTTVLHIRKRADFLKARASGKSAATSGLVLQTYKRNDSDNSIRVGFTATTKLGNAVIRNKVKRRLRAAAREIINKHAKPGHDYVIIGRFRSATRDFQALLKDLKYALHNTDTFK